MSIFNSGIVGKVIDNVAGVGDKLIKNSATGDTQNARTYNGDEGFLSQNIHEMLVLIMVLSLLVSSYVNIDEETLTTFRQGFLIALGFFYGRSRR